MVLGARIDVLETTLPGAKQPVFDLAHRRLTLAGPKGSQEHKFFHGAHAAIDAIMQVTKADPVSLGTTVPLRPVLSSKPQSEPDRVHVGKPSETMTY